MHACTVTKTDRQIEGIIQRKNIKKLFKKKRMSSNIKYRLEEHFKRELP